jgi:hypothetical protein
MSRTARCEVEGVDVGIGAGDISERVPCQPRRAPENAVVMISSRSSMFRNIVVIVIIVVIIVDIMVWPRN